MMVLENAYKFKEYLGNLFDEMGFCGSSEIVGNNINLNIIPKDNNDLPTKEQVLEKLKEITLKKKKQELESGNKIFDFYSDRNFTDFKGVSRLPEITLNASKNTDADIIHSFIPQARTLKE